MNGVPRRTEADDRPGLEALARRVGPDRLLEALDAAWRRIGRLIAACNSCSLWKA